MATDDVKKHETVLRMVLTLVSGMDMTESPPQMGRRIHNIIKEITGNQDPYSEVKKQYNDFALNLYPDLEKRVLSSVDPFLAAIKLAATGNLIDFGPNASGMAERVKAAIDDCFNQPVNLHVVETLREKVLKGGSILYLGDNAGEIVFDRLIIEQIPRDNITFAVRGAPIINDATMEDADACGITKLVKVVNNGSDVPGTVLESCSDDFRELYAHADTVIAKGQGNYETLSDEDRQIFFILKAKCPVIAGDIGCEVDDIVIISNR